MTRAPGLAPEPSPGSALVRDLRRRASRRWLATLLALASIVLAAFALTLVLGQSYTPPVQVLAVLRGEDVPGASFTVGRLRLPRATLAILAGLCFGLAGAAFQTLLRNPLASPDIIGISYGASAAASVAIVFFGLSGAAVTAFAVAAGLGVSTLIYLLAYKDGAAGTRLILMGIGIAALLQSVITYTLSRASEWSLQDALRWLAGSVNAASWGQVLPLLIVLPLLGLPLLATSRDLETLRLGDDAAQATGVRVGLVRLVVLLTATGLICFATAAAGPISFVAFLAGPITARLTGSGRSLLLPAALTGAALVILADYAGQFLLPSRYPVGIVTGAFGAVYLLYLIGRVNRRGAAL
ncbi:FecCD family ABC transporter permease [Pseudoroseicyclus aestuarii]|uniref:Iron complex transport system permease protein n=1 Tax=Pseudoroseicyclus aestuarii TaxID=1795041 RepID=A0A318SS35_9RHOB|nr:iron chelate uptake ABC transporter family permease subunit [Pseudoroseicyclus aestuarii]PYE81319.1 iron complex transport system permease protein [Pseudoroseicyclus aestuarii]